MAEFLEIWKAGGTAMVALESGRVAVGKADTNDVCIEDDPTVSSLHAVVERFGPGWCIRDLGSTNGTFVNGEKLGAERVLRPGDEIRVGQTRLVFRSGADRPVTQMAEAPPEVSGDARRVLVALCRPILTGDVFSEPGTLAEIARETGLPEADADAHLDKLCGAFAVSESGDARRARLANEAVRRGAVSLADVRG